jgi:hypothetical protein
LKTIDRSRFVIGKPVRYHTKALESPQRATIVLLVHYGGAASHGFSLLHPQISPSVPIEMTMIGERLKKLPAGSGTLCGSFRILEA